MTENANRLTDSADVAVDSTSRPDDSADVAADGVLRYLLTFSYDGTDYHGWQIQPNGMTVQERLQTALSTLLRQDITVTGAGRTDTGVHARTMTAHFDFSKTLDCRQLVYKLNRLLPRDVAVSRAEQVNPELHARFSAKSRTYHYYVHQQKDPFRRHYSCELHYDLDFERMNEAAAHLLSVSDFKAFCKTHTDVKTTICQVTEARWISDAPGCWHFRITANRFLRNMVRAVVGTLIEVGRGRLSLEAFDAVVEGRNRSDAGESMPANALFLEDIKY